MRFYDVDAGSITLNGHDVRDFDRSALREGFGMVLQDLSLIHILQWHSGCPLLSRLGRSQRRPAPPTG